MVLSEIIATLKQLLILLDRYGDKSIQHQINEVSRAIYLGETTKDIDEIKEIISHLYPPRGGLTDFYYWDPDEVKRIPINKEIGALSDKLWEFIK